VPKPKQLLKLAEPWRPYRTLACWYLWRSLDQKTP
jgi:DNA-3-methyladenine glycosylase II